MNHKIVSFFGKNIPKKIILLQKKVFELYDIDIEQISFRDDMDNDRHAIAIEDYLIHNNDWDSITIFDVDCIPIRKNCISVVMETIKDDKTIYGNAQASNLFDINLHKTPPFVAPSFMSFTKKLWENSICKSFKFTHYKNPDGYETEVDVAEMFTRENEKQGNKIVLAYPTKTLTDYTWEYDGSFGYKKFNYGNGTEYESGTFHNFQIRIPDKQKIFIDYCNKLLYEN